MTFPSYEAMKEQGRSMPANMTKRYKVTFGELTITEIGDNGQELPFFHSGPSCYETANYPVLVAVEGLHVEMLGKLVEMGVARIPDAATMAGNLTPPRQ